ncbi:MAG: hypothetical protein HY749_06420 [Gammaproteobacteria bacterium]|nr:hypothetical protein [Gammaproteobacteria bacterium]
MKISRTMLRDHLRGVTVSYFSHHDVAPVDIGDYAPFAANVRDSAARRGDLPWLKLGLAHVLERRGQDWDDLNGGIYAFGRGELVDLIEIVWEELWPEEAPAAVAGAADVELVEMSTEDWNAHKAGLAAPGA